MKNAISKQHVRWSCPPPFGGKPKSIKEWVAVCPKCKITITTTNGFPWYNTKNTRKTAKDALFRHLAIFH